MLHLYILLLSCVIASISCLPAIKPVPPVCMRPTYPPVVKDKAEAYQYLRGEYGYYSFRDMTYEFRRDWLNINKYPQIRLTEKQKAWWNKIAAVEQVDRSITLSYSIYIYLIPLFLLNTKANLNQSN